MSAAGPSQRKLCFAWACLAALLALGLVCASVQFRFHGNWTGLFCVGAQERIPPNLRARLFVFPESSGYDGQFYYYIACDPFRQGYANYLDAPQLRYRRILVPLGAWALGLGNPAAIPFAYVAIVLLSVLLGAYWTGRFTNRPRWGLGFLCLPAVLISLDRMVVDGTMAALTAGFAVYSTRQRGWKLYVVLALGALVRETGFLLAAAFCLWVLWERQWRRALWFATAVIPSLLWTAFIDSRIPSERIPAFTWLPLRTWIEAFLHPLTYPALPIPSWLLPALDRLGLIGGLAAIVFSVRTGKGPVRVAAVLFGALAAWHGLPGTWLDGYGYTRSFGPLFLLVALDGNPIPAALPLPRVLLQLAGQFARAMFGW